MSRVLASVAASVAVLFLGGCAPTLFIGDSLLMGGGSPTDPQSVQPYVNAFLKASGKDPGVFMGGPGQSPCNVAPPDLARTNFKVYNQVLAAAPGRVVIAMNGNLPPNTFFGDGCYEDLMSRINAYGTPNGVDSFYSDAISRIIGEIRRANPTVPIELMYPVPTPDWFGGGLWGNDMPTGNARLRHVLDLNATRTNVTTSNAAFEALSLEKKFTDRLPCTAPEITGGYCQGIPGRGNWNYVRSEYWTTKPPAGVDGGLHWFWGWIPPLPGQTVPYSSGAQRYADALTRSSRF